MLLCFYAHSVRSGLVCEGLSEKGGRLVWNGEDNALCLSCLLCRSMSARVSGGLYATLSLVGVV